MQVKLRVYRQQRDVTCRICRGSHGNGIFVLITCSEAVLDLESDSLQLIVAEEADPHEASTGEDKARTGGATKAVDERWEAEGAVPHLDVVETALKGSLDVEVLVKQQFYSLTGQRWGRQGDAVNSRTETGHMQLRLRRRREVGLKFWVTAASYLPEHTGIPCWVGRYAGSSVNWSCHHQHCAPSFHSGGAAKRTLWIWLLHLLGRDNRKKKEELSPMWRQQNLQKHHLSLVILEYVPWIVPLSMQSSNGFNLTFSLLGQSESLLDEEEEHPDCKRSQAWGREHVFLHLLHQYQNIHSKWGDFWKVRTFWLICVNLKELF